MVDFFVPVDHKVKLRISEKKIKYIDLARELKRIVMVLPIVIGALITLTEW